MIINHLYFIFISVSGTIVKHNNLYIKVFKIVAKMIKFECDLNIQ